uniref:Putative secreted protein n=1 Tax=Ixodes ricinus TaxID=34613 RepID=A0A6B0UBC8_IXORI
MRRKRKSLVCVFFPMLDAFIQGIEERFTEEAFELVCAMQNLFCLSAGDQQIALICSLSEMDLDNLRAEMQLLMSRTSNESVNNMTV